MVVVSLVVYIFKLLRILFTICKLHYHTLYPKLTICKYICVCSVMASTVGKSYKSEVRFSGDTYINILGVHLKQ